MNLTPDQIIKKARNGMPQQEFGKLIGKSQSTICKYESSDASPPRNVIIQCMNILNEKPTTIPVSIEDLISRMRELLNGREKEDLRNAMMLILNNLVKSE